MIKMVAIDLDDTLLNHDLEIPQVNVDVIRRAEEQGITVVLASGRAPAAMKKYAQQLGMFHRQGFLIADNGASILSTVDWRVVSQFPVNADLARQAWEIVRKAGFPMQFYGDGQIFTSDNFNEYSEMDTRLTGQPLVPVKDFSAALEQPRIKFVIPGDPAGIIKLEKTLKERFAGQANIFTSKAYFLEILNPEADKGRALQTVSRSAGFSPDQVMAIGDAMNDFGMLKFAGHAVAMANARAEVKEIAEYITEKDNEAGGVAEAIVRFLD